jgi:predicted CoA-substrate-specific enzyme activase
MRITDVISNELVSQIKGYNLVGIDIGSRAAKGVLLSQGELYVTKIPTGLSMQSSADELLDNLLENSGLTRDQIHYAVGTGYGRVALAFSDIPYQIVTEISCHGMGCHFLNAGTQTIIDIGGQDSKAIKIDPQTGKVLEFFMNEKCAAGTGRFLEVVAGLLGYTIDSIGQKALSSKKELEISSQCVVFAESEIVSLKARGEAPEDIAAGVHFAAAKRVANLTKRFEWEPDLVFSGGVANNEGMRHALEVLIGHPIKRTKLDMIYAGALGAAVYAQQLLEEHNRPQEKEKNIELDLSGLQEKIRVRQQEFAVDETVKKIGYICSYMPVEILNASGADHVRLFKAGDTETVARGEILTKSIFCDLTKSCLGAFQTGDPLYSSVDKVYLFNTCDFIKRTAEAINEFFKPTEIFLLPHDSKKENSRRFFKQEIINLKEDAEQLTGKHITDKGLREQVALYNKLRILIKKISELRKRNNPPLTGKDFLEIVKGFYYLPPEEALVIYQELYDRLAAMPDNNNGTPKLRIMVSGAIIADGDDKLLDIIENELGARVVVEDHCTGVKPFYSIVDENQDPYQALADGYLDQAPCARMNSLENILEFSGNMAKEYHVDAVIYSYLKFCSCYGLAKKSFVQHFQSLGIPVLEISSDYSQSDLGQIKTRVEAFIEVITRQGGYKYGK